MNDKKVLQYSEELKKLGIENQIVEHPDLRTPAETLGYLGLGMDGGSSTLIMKADGEFIAVVRRDDCKLDFKKIKKTIGSDDLRIATPEEFVAATGLPIGAARVYNPGMRTYIDKRVLDREYLVGGSGNFVCSIRSKTQDLLKIPNSKVIDVAEQGNKEIKQAHNKRILSGMRSSGKLHLGNYLGAAKGMLALQNDPQYETLYMVADLHALTTPYDKETLAESTLNVVKDYLAAGLDPEKSILFVDSQVPEVIELAYYFSTVTTMAKMLHLPTYKEKVKQYPENSTMALLNYPVLMAADILVYKAGLVPVGIDQEPHLEVAREIARRMNQDYGTDFPEPTRFATKGEYIPSLAGEGKMSKSVEGSYISLSDSLQEIKAKLAKAPTDAGGPGELPKEGAVANLFKFVELFMPNRLEYYAGMYRNGGLRYSDLKEELANGIYQEIKPMQDKRKTLTDEYVRKVIAQGAIKARKIAQETVREVKGKMGLI